MLIATIMNCVFDYGRRALEGIARYGNAHGGWTLVLHHEAQTRQVLPKLDSKVCGIITHAYQPKLIEQLMNLAIPVVNVSAVSPSPQMVSVLPDNQAIGRMAAEHLINQGYRRLLAFDISPWDYSQVRIRSFEQYVQAHGLQVEVVRINRWKHAELTIAQTLSSTQTPVGVFAVSDSLAVFVVRQCAALGLVMPEQVAVLGVDNDILTTRMMTPTISSIEIPWEKLGFEAAARLDAMIKGQSLDFEPLRIGPTRVMTRQTTDGMAIEDANVATVVKFIREKMHEPFTLDELVRQVPISRRTLEQRFKRTLGHTLHHHVVKVRIERAKDLLTQTDYAMPEVAKHCGFGEAAYFAAVFKKQTGKTPTEFRADYRLI